MGAGSLVVIFSIFRDIFFRLGEGVVGMAQ